MCIICVKPQGLPVILDDLIRLKECWNSNPDGAGFMYRDKGQVVINKGYMAWHLLEEWLLTNVDWMKDREMVFHFRWSTHGTNSEANCHPFPLSNDTTRLQQLDLRTSSGLVHNGVISDKFAPVDAEHSDTHMFIKSKLSNVKRTKRVKLLVEEGSKYALMTGEKTTLVGKFHQEFGWSWSNYSYEEPLYDNAYNSKPYTSQDSKWWYKEWAEQDEEDARAAGTYIPDAEMDEAFIEAAVRDANTYPVGQGAEARKAWINRAQLDGIELRRALVDEGFLVPTDDDCMICGAVGEGRVCEDCFGASETGFAEYHKSSPTERTMEAEPEVETTTTTPRRMAGLPFNGASTANVLSKQSVSDPIF